MHHIITIIINTIKRSKHLCNILNNYNNIYIQIYYMTIKN